MYTISISDICNAASLSRQTVWRLLRGRQLPFAYHAGHKHFAVATVVARLRERGVDDKLERRLLHIDKEKRTQNVLR